MRINVTEQLFLDHPELMTKALDVVFASLGYSSAATSPELLATRMANWFARHEVDLSAVTHAQIQYCINNNVEIQDAELWSPPRTQAEMTINVPAAWPGSTDAEGNPIKLHKYCQYVAVDDGSGVAKACIKFSNGPCDAYQNITLPTWAQTKAWITWAGGFLTKDELDAIRVIPDEP